MITDLRWALRWLRRNPLFATAVVSILGLGIGANTAAFSIAEAAGLGNLNCARDLAGESFGPNLRAVGLVDTGSISHAVLRWTKRSWEGPQREALPRAPSGVQGVGRMSMGPRPGEERAADCDREAEDRAVLERK